MEIGDEHFVKVAAGEFHTLAVTQYGDVRAFGRGREGQLGHGRSSMLDTHVPQKVPLALHTGSGMSFLLGCLLLYGGLVS